MKTVALIPIKLGSKSKTVLSEGDYIVLYPEMAHRGAVICQKSEKVLKIVGKVRI